jgi:putative transposase
LLKVDVFSYRGTDPAEAFLHRFTEKHDIADSEFLVDAGGSLIALGRHDLNGHLDCHDRNQIKK